MKGNETAQDFREHPSTIDAAKTARGVASFLHFSFLFCVLAYLDPSELEQQPGSKSSTSPCFF